MVELSRLSIDPDIKNTRYRARLYAAAIRAGVTACIAMDARHLLARHSDQVAVVLSARDGVQRRSGRPSSIRLATCRLVLLGRPLDDELKRRLARNMFFKIDDDELDDLKTLLPSLYRSGAGGGLRLFA